MTEKEEAVFLENFHPGDVTNLRSKWEEANPVENFIEPTFGRKTAQRFEASMRRHDRCPYRIGPPVGKDKNDTQKLKEYGYEGMYVIKSKLSSPEC